MAKAAPLQVFEAPGLARLFAALRSLGWELAGPVIRDGAIVYGAISEPADLPVGWTDEHAPGHYRIKPRGDRAYFGYGIGAQSWKKYLYPAAVRLWTATRRRAALSARMEQPDARRIAFIGVRACELAAIALHDKVFLRGAHEDPDYRARRETLFVVAVNCAAPGATCFCASTRSGPVARRGFDVALTEVLGGAHRFVAEAGSERGAALLQSIGARAAIPADLAAVETIHAKATLHMGRSLPNHGLRERLQQNLEHPRWDEIAKKCLACSNCTMVCPTCFCSSLEDVPDLALHRSERWRKWDSCFTGEFSYIHGGSVRPGVGSRYRQWLMHKLCYTEEQFGTGGCVGCGRCITWCPAGIDITEEARAIAPGEVKP